jgi:GNAT superfamily N-acetyltransferase
MNTRLANKFDVNDILRMLGTFIDTVQLPGNTLKNPDFNYFNKLYHHIIIGGGLAVVAESDNKVVGMLIGIKDQNILSPNDITLREMIFWIDPDYQKTRAGYKLLKTYISEAEKLREQDIIKVYTMTNTENLENINYERFGFRKIEETYAIGL